MAAAQPVYVRARVPFKRCQIQTKAMQTERPKCDMQEETEDCLCGLRALSPIRCLNAV